MYNDVCRVEAECCRGTPHDCPVAMFVVPPFCRGSKRASRMRTPPRILPVENVESGFSKKSETSLTNGAVEIKFPLFFLS